LETADRDSSTCPLEGGQAESPTEDPRKFSEWTSPRANEREGEEGRDLQDKCCRDLTVSEERGRWTSEQ
jgi:hypothetical protein